MAFRRFTPEPLTFPLTALRDGHTVDIDYTVPPVDIDRGWRLSELLAMSQDELDTQGITNEDLFGLALTPELWQRMRDDGVPIADAWRAGVAALAYFRSVTTLTGPPDEVHRQAMTTAEAMWESGLSPEALAAWTAANLQRSTQTSPRATRKAASAADGASTASTSGTRTPPPKKRASTSRSRSSSRTRT